MQDDVYLNKVSSARNSTTELTYNPKTRKWEVNTSVNATQIDKSNVLSSKNSSTGATAPTNITKQVVQVNNTNSTVDSKTKADKEYIEIEFNTLEGDLVLTSTEKSIRINVNDTIKIVGIGKYLSGLYFVSSVKRSLSKSDGFTQSFTVMKNGFGNSLKSIQASPKQTTRKTEVAKKVSELKVGDKVKIVGKNAVYSNASDGVKVPEWVKQKVLTVDAISKDKTRVRLNPIWSWTYTKFVKKV